MNIFASSRTGLIEFLVHYYITRFFVFGTSASASGYLKFLGIIYIFFNFFQKTVDPGTLNKMFTRSGYLFLMEKKALGTTWNKYYCHYQREGRLFCMIPYNQATGKMMSTDSFRLKTCTRRISDSIDKRFCFDITPEDK